MRTTIEDASSALPSSKKPSTFAELGLSPFLCDALQRAGYVQPTPIQQAAIPLCLRGRDVLGFAQTGTGKTAAFALPILHRLLSDPPQNKNNSPVIRALVLSPTRELAAQIGASFAKYSRSGGQSLLRHTVVYGGVSKGPQAYTVRRGVDILVATPGRLLDLMQDGAVNLSHVQCVVLDEADRMLSMGFIQDVTRILQSVPQERQTLLFSATTSPQIQQLAKRALKDPAHVAVTPAATTIPPISQSVYFLDRNDKLSLLVAMLRDPAVESALVFTRTKHVANKISEKLEKLGVPSAAIHGNKSQGARERALQGMKSGHVRVLVATDVAARGIHIQDLSHVINFEIPNEAESYVHRIGRTGRAGATGSAVSFCAADERGFFRSIERLIGKTIERKEVPEDLERIASTASMTSSAHRSGARSSDNRSEQRSSSERSERFDRTERSDRPERAERIERPARPDHRNERFDRPARPEQRGGQFAGPVRSEQRSSDRSDRPTPRSGPSDRPRRPEGRASGRPAGQRPEGRNEQRSDRPERSSYDRPASPDRPRSFRPGGRPSSSSSDRPYDSDRRSAHPSARPHAPSSDRRGAHPSARPHAAADRRGAHPSARPSSSGRPAKSRPHQSRQR